MREHKAGKVIGKAVAGDGFLRWTLAIAAFIAFLVGAGGGAGISLLIGKFFSNLALWMQALPGAGFAVFIALFTLWTTMSSNRKFFYFKQQE